MKKQALAIAIASAMVAPSAFAAQDTSGMHFTSASEGFYASLRARLDFSSGNRGADIENNSSRFGIRGTNDLGGGLEGFYQWEGGISIESGGFSDNAVRVRLGNVGLRGNFGELIVGSFWPNDYNWTFGGTDIANNYSGFLVYNGDREGRTSKSIQYTTPDLNGFQGAIRIRTDNKGSNDGPGNDDNDLDAWNLAATYAVQGFTVAGSYNVVPDGLTKTNAEFNPRTIANGGDEETTAAVLDDRTAWTVRLGYAQDNWYVKGWYGETNNSDGVNSSVRAASRDAVPGGTGANANALVGDTTASNDSAEDVEIFSIAAGVSVDKVNLYVGYETAENSNAYGQGNSGNNGQESTYGLVGVQYNLGSQSRVWIEYWNRDIDANPNRDDIVSVGLRHDF